MFKIKPGEVRFMFDNNVIVHVRNDASGFASVVCWELISGHGWSFDLRAFEPASPHFPEQTMNAVELAEFLWRMSRWQAAERVATC